MMLKTILTALGITGVVMVNAQTVTTIAQTAGTPSGIALDANGDVYVAERTPTSIILKIEQPSGVTSTYKSFSSSVDPLKIRFQPNGDLFVSDYAGGTILRIVSGGGPILNYVTGATNPCGMVFDGDTLYFMEYVSQKIYKVLPGGGAVGTSNVIELALPGTWMGSGKRATGLELFGNDRLMVTSALNYSIYSVNKRNLDIDTLADAIQDMNNFDLVMLSNGTYYFPGNYTNHIYAMDTINYNYNVFFGNGNQTSVDGQDTVASFYGPYFIAKDNNDNLFVTDVNTYKVRKISNVISGVTEYNKDFFSLYPNPVTDELKIDFEKETDFIILTMRGEIVKQFAGKTNYSIPVHELSNGLYLIKTANGTTQRFFKM